MANAVLNYFYPTSIVNIDRVALAVFMRPYWVRDVECREGGRVTSLNDRGSLFGF